MVYFHVKWFDIFVTWYLVLQIEIEYTYRAGSQLRVEDKTSANPPVVHAGNGDAEGGDDDDLNIDDI